MSTQDQSNVLARAVGRRKEATAQVKIVPGTGEFIINNKSAEAYLQNNSSLLAVKSPFDGLQNIENVPKMDQVNVFVKVEGGGLVGQAQAIKLAVARAVCQFDQSENSVIRKGLKDLGYLTQDARVKERRKYGLKKARKASQYHKR
jgi:small subunit ribosomal protein S9